MDEERQRRIAQNEDRFRRANDRQSTMVVEFIADEPETFVMMCECAKLDCDEMLPITPDAYRKVRDHSTRFVVFPGHVVDEVERVVEQHDPYWVIEKLGAGATEAARLDE